MTNITKLTISQLRKGLLAKDFSAKELTAAYIDNIKQKDKHINSYIEVTEEKAYKMAAESDLKIAKNEARPLEAIPFGIKDLYCTKNIKTQACSKILDGFTPKYESTVTDNLWQDGAILLGKLNMDEFAMGSTNKNSAFGNVVNPLKSANSDKKLVPGGSSGGSAAAVAADLCAASLGSDTGGSVRQPASFTGLVGLKPTYGRCSRWGMIAYASSLDQAGHFSKTVEDSALILNSTSSYDKKDSTSANVASEDFTRKLGAGVKGLRIGVAAEYVMEGMNEDIQKSYNETVNLLKNLGAKIVEISLPHTIYGAPAYYIISTAEASSNLARYDGVKYGIREYAEGDSLDDMYAKSRASGFGAEVKRRIMLGTYVLSSGYYDAYYKKAQKVRRLFANDFNSAFAQVDAIITPTTPNTAFGIEDKPTLIETYYNDIFTVPANLAGLPAISVPVGVDKNNLPIGVQLMAPRFQEAELLKIANNIEKEVAFKRDNLNYII